MPNRNARTAAARAEVKPVPLDAEPGDAPQHVWVVTERMVGFPQIGEMRKSQAAAYRSAGGLTYQRHWYSCTGRDQWKTVGKYTSRRPMKKGGA